MLNFVIGPAGTGKSRYLIDAMTQRAESGHQSWLIVPEQASFQNEKLYWQILGEKYRYVEVLSFKRMCQIIVGMLEENEKKPINDTAAAVLMCVAMEEISDQLDVYKRHYKSGDFISQMLNLIGECENSGISAEQMSSFSFSLPEGGLKEKTYELSLIMDTYKAVASESYCNEGDVLRHCGEQINRNSWILKDIEVFIDDFGSFTYPELEMIESLIIASSNTTITICSDGINTKSPAFKTTDDTYKQLLELATKAGVENRSILLQRKDNYKIPKQLSRMEQFATMWEGKEEAKEENVMALVATSPYEELSMAAAKISELVREKGLHYSEIAILTRNISRYEALLDMVMKKYDIPYFYDAVSDPQSNILCSFLIQCVGIAAEEQLNLFDLAKSPLSGVEVDKAGELENYCYIWSLYPSAQLKPFLNNPNGMEKDFDAGAIQKLDGIEETRAMLSAPILNLKNHFYKQTGKAFAKGIYQLIKDLSLDEKMLKYGDALKNNKNEFFEEQNLMWDQIMDVLDLFYNLPEGIKLDQKRGYELFAMALGTLKVATVPQNIDQVAVGTVDRMRANAPRAVFLLGAVLGEFPTLSISTPLLSERDRKAMNNNGLQIGFSQKADAHEKMLCYRALTAASEYLQVSFPASSEKGEILSPSNIYNWAELLSVKSNFSETFLAQNPKSALSLYAQNISENTVVSETLKRVCQKTFGEEEIEKLEESAVKTKRYIQDKQLMLKLFSNNLRLSPSKVERYYSCPYSYFLNDGLKLKKIEKAELSASEAGSLIHYCLEQVISEFTPSQVLDLNDDVLDDVVTNIINAYLTQKTGDTTRLPKRMHNNFLKLSGWICELIKRLSSELLQSEFSPIAFEQKIDEMGNTPPIILRTAQGVKVSIEGIVDRIDVATINGKRYVRVIDYKSGSKTFSLTDIYYGLNMQMLIYLFSISKNGKEQFANLLPAGILYQPAMGKYHNLSRNTTQGDVEREKMKHYRMNGLLLDDEQVLTAMETDGQGIFIPTKADKPNYQALASLEELGKIKRLIENRITKMAGMLLDGEIKAVPYSKKDTTPCEYCNYRVICGFETGDEVVNIEELSREEILKEMS